MNKRVHKPESGESGESGGQQTRQSRSLVDRLIRELSGAPVGTDGTVSPVCKRCHDRGEPCEELSIGTGEPVYVCLYWEAWSGWRVLGVYHATHTESIRSILEDPQKPVVVFEGEYEDLSPDDADATVSGTYVLSALSYVDMTFPEAMVSPTDVTF